MLAFVAVECFGLSDDGSRRSQKVEKDVRALASLIRFVEETGLESGRPWEVEVANELLPIETGRRDGSTYGRDLGFGLTFTTVRWNGGHSTPTVEIVALDRKVLEYRVVSDYGPGVWPRIRERINPVWKDRGFDLIESSEGLFLSIRFAETEKALAARLRQRLLSAPRVAVPAEWKVVYEDMLSPFVRGRIGYSCGSYGGSSAPVFLALTEWAIEEGRVDVLRSLLAGPDPEARVDAVLGLRTLAHRGLELAADTQRAMMVVLLATEPVWSCSGCVYYTTDVVGALADIEYDLEVFRIIETMKLSDANATPPTPRPP